MYSARQHLERAEKLLATVGERQAENPYPTGPDFSAAVAKENRLLALAHAHIDLAQAINADKLANPDTGFHPA